MFLLYFNAWYMLLFVLAEIAVFIWKGERVLDLWLFLCLLSTIIVQPLAITFNKRCCQAIQSKQPKSYFQHWNLGRVAFGVCESNQVIGLYF